MSAGAPAYRAVAVRYAERATTYGDAYYRWASYGEPDGRLDMSYYFWVLFGLDGSGGGPIVIDTGFEPVRGERMGRTCLCRPSEGLARVGVDAEAVQRLVISHMHYDHIGNIDLFPNARIAISETDYRFWAEDPVAQRPQFAPHTDPDGVQRLREAVAEDRVDFLGPREEIAPGVTTIEVGGHSPGQIVFDIPGEHGRLALAGDAVHYEAELETDRPFGVFSDLGGMYRAYDIVREMLDDGAVLVPGHDPLVMDRFPRMEGDAGEIAVCLTDTRRET